MTDCGQKNSFVLRSPSALILSSAKCSSFSCVVIPLSCYSCSLPKTFLAGLSDPAAKSSSQALPVQAHAPSLPSCYDLICISNSLCPLFCGPAVVCLLAGKHFCFLSTCHFSVCAETTILHPLLVFLCFASVFGSYSSPSRLA